MIRHGLTFALVSALVGIAGCATPDKPVRATLYDFGPGLATNATATATATAAPSAAAPAALQPAVVLADIAASGALDGSAVLYRLGYADSHQLRPYANARWTAPPAQLIRQRLREQLSRDRSVLDASESASLARTGGVMPRMLRIEVEEFSHYFESQVQSSGLLRLRLTLLENTPAGERLLAQRALIVQRPAPSADAPGGVRALAAATDAAAEEIGRWLAQAP